MGRGQALLGAGDQNREPTVEGEKSHRTQDGHRDGLLRKGSRRGKVEKGTQSSDGVSKPKFLPTPSSESWEGLFFLCQSTASWLSPSMSSLFWKFPFCQSHRKDREDSTTSIQLFPWLLTIFLPVARPLSSQWPLFLFLYFH